MPLPFFLTLVIACGPGARQPEPKTDSQPGGDLDSEAPCEPSTWYADADADGYGDAAVVVSECEAPEGTTADATDCDDTRADAFPGAAETCNGADDDCDDEIDEDVVGAGTFYLDADGDGYGDASAPAVSCEAPVGYVTDATDCDDTDAAVFPGAEEADCADPVDYNCDGSTQRVDLDSDGWAACEECDDADPARSPGTAEICDGAVDEDCDGLVDDDDDDVSDATTWYRDADGDGWGNDALATTQCEEPTGFTALGGDCDDADVWSSPGLAEVCDIEDLDEDCSGAADDADVGTDASTFVTYARDADEDGYGDATRTVTQCDAPSGYGTDATDCDDADASLSPGSAEVCDGVDNDCDALVDDDDDSLSDGTVYYADADADGFGDATSTQTACALPTGFVENGDDCDDADATTGECPTVDTDVGDTGVEDTDVDDTGKGEDTGDTGATSAPVRFVVLGDTGDGSAGQYAVAAGMEAVCGALGCDFALLAGDNFYPGGVTSTTDALWTNAFELPYTNLDMQFWAVMGNHDWDHTTDTAYLDAQVGYTSVSPKWYMPADYYSRVEGDVTFYGIDTHLIDVGVGAAQEAWLPVERAASTTTWNLVFGHHPYVSNGPHGNADPNVETFVDSYVCGEFDVYFAGHDHNLQWLGETCDTTFIVSGGGKSTYPLYGTNATLFEAESTGFLWVEIDGSTLTGVFYDQDGVELYRGTITK